MAMAAARIAVWALAATLLGQGAAAQTSPRTRERGRVTRAEFDRLADEVERQKLLLEQIIRLQQEHVRALTQLLGGIAATAPAPAPAPPAPAPPAPAPAPPAPARATAPPPRPAEPRPAEPRPPARPAEEGRGSIVGKVLVRGGSPENAWIYLESSEQGGPHVASMAQKGKQFVPNILVVERGTRVDFPNMDPDLHNVFSLSSGNEFDLGTYGQGRSKSVLMEQPGVISVYCNVHPQMIGLILVVPGRTYARVGKEGFFHLDNLPPGPHRVAAWAPNAPTVRKEVTVSDNVVNVELTLTVGETKPHLRKDGTPYGSYSE
jgi:plastocyanin